MGMTFQAVYEIEKGAPFEVIYPPEGSPYTMGATALIQGRQHNEEILKVFEFIINDFNMYDKEHFSPELTYKGQSISMPSYPENIQYADMTGITELAEKERLLLKWEY